MARRKKVIDKKVKEKPKDTKFFYFDKKVNYESYRLKLEINKKYIGTLSIIGLFPDKQEYNIKYEDNYIYPTKDEAIIIDGKKFKSIKYLIDDKK